MMMPRILEFDPRRRDPHPLQSKAYGDRPMHHRSVLRRDEIHLGIRGGRGALLRPGKGGNQCDAPGGKQTIHTRISSRGRAVRPSYSCRTAYRNTPASLIPSTTIFTTKKANS